ncbi:hypothetical protein KC19_VG163600 [Ceratodon purpureus]|nr:hypothetical protein KC19_VG163600 [Ceratodon purpureus]
MSVRYPLTDVRRIRARDDKLWIRNQQRASVYKLSRIPCPCKEQKGTGLPFRIEEVERHLQRHGRAPECRTSKVPMPPDSSDDEWEADFSYRVSAGTMRQ